MKRFRLLTVEDDPVMAAGVHQTVREILQEWLPVKQGIFTIWDPEDRPSVVSTVEEWEQEVHPSVTPADVVTLTTIDLEIPHRPGEDPVPEAGIDIIDQCVGTSRFPCCVVSTHHAMARDISDIPFLTKRPDGAFPMDDPRIMRFTNKIRATLASRVEWLRYPYAGTSKRIILSPDRSNQLRYIYLDQGPTAAEAVSQPLPILLVGDPGCGRGLFIRYLAHLMDAELKTIEVCPHHRFDLAVVQQITQLSDRLLQDPDSQCQLFHICFPDRPVGVAKDKLRNLIDAIDDLLKSSTTRHQQRRSSSLGIVFSMNREHPDESYHAERLPTLFRKRLQQVVVQKRQVTLPSVVQRGRAYVIKLIDELLWENSGEKDRQRDTLCQPLMCWRPGARSGLGGRQALRRAFEPSPGGLAPRPPRFSALRASRWGWLRPARNATVVRPARRIGLC